MPALPRTEDQLVAHCAAVKKVHDKHRRKGVCINSKTHGKAWKGGRCKGCWRNKLAAERTAYAARKLLTNG